MKRLRFILTVILVLLVPSAFKSYAAEMLADPQEPSFGVKKVAAAGAAHTEDPCAFPASPVAHPEALTRFIAFGDSGTGSAEQYQLSHQMEAARQITEFHTALMLGDNLYPRGNTSQAESRFEQPYADLLKAKVKFYPVLGNHDLRTFDGRGEINYFKMPGRWYSVEQEPAEFFMLDSNRTQLTEKQLTWLASALSSSAVRWKVVATHHPIYSSGKHGTAWWLKVRLEPLLIKHKVNLVLSGHDHDYERFKPQRGIYYFVSGGGGGNVTPIRTLGKFTESAVSAPHFLLFELGQSQSWFQAINICGRVFDSGVLTMQPKA
jgi:calcineurin-like phosphoesterase family protein